MAYADNLRDATATKRTAADLIDDLEIRINENSYDISVNTANNILNRKAVKVANHSVLINTTSATKVTMHSATVDNLSSGGEILIAKTTFNFSFGSSLGTTFTVQYDFGGTIVGPYTITSGAGGNASDGKKIPISIAGRFQVSSANDIEVKTEWFSNGTVAIYSYSGETRIYTTQGP